MQYDVSINTMAAGVDDACAAGMVDVAAGATGACTLFERAMILSISTHSSKSIFYRPVKIKIRVCQK